MIVDEFDIAWHFKWTLIWLSLATKDETRGLPNRIVKWKRHQRLKKRY